MTASQRRAAIVTGAASGIGAAIAARFAEDGIDALAVDLYTDRPTGVADAERPFIHRRTCHDGPGLDRAMRAGGTDVGGPLIHDW